MVTLAQNITTARWFSGLIIALILLAALLVGLETSTSLMDQYGTVLVGFNHVVLASFVLEAALKITACWPRPTEYFRDRWNIFDFSIVVLSLLPIAGEAAMVARLLRLLRVVRLISAIPELRLIVNTLIRSIPSMGNVIVLMSIIFYIYAVTGFHLFHEHDPTHWKNLGLALLTLFRIVTLEDWTDVMYTAMEMHPLAWIYFVSFVVLGTFVVINLFIAVVLNNLDEAKAEALNRLTGPVTADELLNELRDTRRSLEKLEKKLQRME
jgi:voltage-gated sodium channel